MGLIENWGTGIPALFEDSKAYDFGEPTLAEDNEYFRVSVRRRDFETDAHGAVNPIRQKPASPDAEALRTVAAVSVEPCTRAL